MPVLRKSGGLLCDPATVSPKAEAIEQHFSHSCLESPGGMTLTRDRQRAPGLSIPYRVLLERAAEKVLGRLPLQMHERVITAIQALASDPRPPGCRKLAGSKNDWRIRVGDYRVIYEIADKIRVVRVNRVRHRRET